MGPFNTPVPKPVTKVQIEGRIIVPGDTNDVEQGLAL